MITKEKGQALIEFVVFAVALIPLFLLIPYIAKYQDIAHSAQMASRYVAFEATTRNDAYGSWKPPAQLAGEVRRRFFSNPNAPIKTNDTAGDFKAHQNLFWRDPQGKSLLPKIDDAVRVTFGADNSNDHGGAFNSASDGQPFVLKSQLSLAAQGIYTANVEVKVANLTDKLTFFEPFNKLDLVMRRSTSLVIDGWSGRDPSSVQSKLDNAIVFPGKLLKPFNDAVIKPAILISENLGSISAPKLGELDYWKDVLPKDRLRAK